MAAAHAAQCVHESVGDDTDLVLLEPWLSDWAVPALASAAGGAHSSRLTQDDRHASACMRFAIAS